MTEGMSKGVHIANFEKFVGICRTHEPGVVTLGMWGELYIPVATVRKYNLGKPDSGRVHIHVYFDGDCQVIGIDWGVAEDVSSYTVTYSASNTGNPVRPARIRLKGFFRHHGIQTFQRYDDECGKYVGPWEKPYFHLGKDSYSGLYTIDLTTGFGLQGGGR